MTHSNVSHRMGVRFALLFTWIIGACHAPMTAEPRLQPPDPRAVQGVCIEDHGAGTRFGNLTMRWVEDGMFDSDEHRKERAQTEIRKYLSSSNHDELHAAVIGLRYVPEAIPDSSKARSVLLPLLDARELSLRHAALNVLRCWMQPGDEQLALDMVSGLPPAEGSEMVGLLSTYQDFDLTGEAGRIVLRILREASDEQLKRALGGLAGATISSEIEAFLLHESNSEECDRSRCFVAHGLANLKAKSAPVVERLLEDVRAYHDEISRHACAGLSCGVAPEMQASVCDAMIELLPGCSEADWDTRSKFLGVLESYGRERQAVAIEALAARHSNTCYVRSRYLDVARIMRWRETQPLSPSGS